MFVPMDTELLRLLEVINEDGSHKYEYPDPADGVVVNVNA